MNPFSLYLVTDRTLSLGRPLVSVVRNAVAGGVTCVQLREKHATSREFYDLARALLAVTRPAGVPLIVNDRLDIALAAGADGVHLGQSDLPLDAARRLVPPDFIVGVSAESTADAVQAAASGATYVAASPVFATPTKTDTAPALGLSGVTALRAALPASCPLVAIGGIHLDNAASVLAAGADGLAVVSEIMSAADPKTAAAALSRLFPSTAIDCHRQQTTAIDQTTLKQPNPPTMKQYPRLLSIAGSDCSGGAGIQADIKTASACGVYAMTAVTAVVDENTVGVTDIHSIPGPMVLGQIRSCLDDIGADAIKIGMLDSPDLIRAIADLLSTRYPAIPVVLDPVMVAQSGDPLVPPEAAAALRTLLVPRATVITPNLPEAAALLDRPIAAPADVPPAARDLCALGCCAALVKGGHFEDGATSDDILYDASTSLLHVYPAPRIPTRNNHGTGCTLSSAIAAHIALGHPLPTAVARAKDYITSAIRAGADYQIGHGHGPVHHFWRLWSSP